MKGKKLDNEKPDWSLLPMKSFEDVIKVLTFGATKYARDNWKKVKPKERYFAACLRHMADYQDEVMNDKESGLPHLAHAICCLIFLHYLSSKKRR